MPGVTTIPLAVILLASAMSGQVPADKIKEPGAPLHSEDYFGTTIELLPGAVYVFDQGNVCRQVTNLDLVRPVDLPVYSADVWQLRDGTEVIKHDGASLRLEPCKPVILAKK